MSARLLSSLTIHELRSHVARIINIPGSLCKAELVEFVLQYAPADVKQHLMEEAHQKTHAQRLERTRRKVRQRRATQQTAEAEDDTSQGTGIIFDSLSINATTSASFLDLPSENEVKACFAAFRQATSPEMFMSRVCAICACEACGNPEGNWQLHSKLFCYGDRD